MIKTCDTATLVAWAMSALAKIQVINRSPDTIIEARKKDL